MFTLLILLFILTPPYLRFSENAKSAASSKNRAMKILIFYILILISTPNSNIPSLWEPSVFPLSYVEVERMIVCLLISLVILLSSFLPDNLEYGYSYYVQNIIRASLSAFLVLFIFKGIRLFISPPDLNINYDLLLLWSYGFFLLGNILPSRVKPKQLPKNVNISMESLFEQYQALKSRNEKIRDALFFGCLCLFLFIWLKWIENYVELFQFIAFIGIVIGFILMFIPSEDKGKGFSSVVGSLTGQSIDPTTVLGSRVQNFAQSIQETEFKKPKRVYSIPTDGLNLIDKGKTKISGSKGSLVIPTVTDKGTALVLMGKSEMVTETDEQKSTTEELEGTTTLWVPREEWDKIKLNLVPKDMDELTNVDLKQAGLETVSEIYEMSKKALNGLKTWKGPQGIFSSVLDETPSKYSIKETKDYTLVKLPGIYVFESKSIEIVNILGGFVKVLQIKGVGEYVQIFGGFITVMETPEYSFVQTPFVSVIETPQGEMIRVFGIDIQEGEKINLAEMRTKIIEDQRNFDEMFTKRIESLFEEDPRLILTDSKGNKKGFLIGEDEVLGDMKYKSKKKKKKQKGSGIKRIDSIKGIDRIERKTKHKKHFHHSKTATFARSKGQMEDVKKIELDENGIPTNHPELDELEDELNRIENSIEEADDKLLKDALSEDKHTEIVGRLKKKQTKLEERLKKLKENLKVKIV